MKNKESFKLQIVKGCGERNEPKLAFRGFFYISL